MYKKKTADIDEFDRSFMHFVYGWVDIINITLFTLVLAHMFYKYKLVFLLVVSILSYLFDRFLISIELKS